MSYSVTFRPSGHQIDIEADENIVEAALRQGFQLPYRCRNGDCGTCVAKVLNGDYEQAQGLQAAAKIAADELLMCSSLPRSDLIVEVDGVLAPGEVVPQEHRCEIVEVNYLSKDVLQIILVPEALPEVPFLAGQYLNLLIDGEQRPYSIASAPENDSFIELHIKEILDHPVNVAIVKRLKQKGQIKVMLPYGRAVLNMHSSRPLLMIAGGTGFAPIKALIESVLINNLQREMTLYWGVGRLEQMYYQDLVERWDRHVPYFHFVPVVAEADEDWAGKTGKVHAVALKDFDDLNAHDVYLSGSMDMVRVAYSDLLAAGLPRNQLYSDMADIIDDALAV